MFAKDTTAADCLRNLRMNGCGVRYNWFLGKDSNLLIGWANDVLTWVHHHRNLLPERYLSDMKRKLDGPGVQFDDAISLCNLTMGSYQEWIIHSRDLIRLEMGRPSLNIGVYKLYDSLPAADKALAKSDGGLPLAKLAPDLTEECLRSCRMMQWPFAPGEVDPQSNVRILLDERAISDPKVIDTMTMRVMSTPIKRRGIRVKPGFGIDTHASADIPPALKLSTYFIRIDYTVDGNKQTVDCPVGVPLPLYSAEREAELIKAAEAKKTDAPAK